MRSNETSSNDSCIASRVGNIVWIGGGVWVDGVVVVYLVLGIVLLAPVFLSLMMLFSFLVVVSFEFFLELRLDEYDAMIYQATERKSVTTSAFWRKGKKGWVSISLAS